MPSDRTDSARAALAGAAAALTLCSGGGCSAVHPPAPRLRVPESPVLRGEPVEIRAEALPPGAAVVLAAEGRDQFGQAWRSRASFRADATGTVVPSRDAPTAGSYGGASREGLFWSMALDRDATTITPMVSIREVALTLAEPGGQVLARASVSFADAAGVTEIPLSGGLHGALFVPAAGGAPRPALVVLGGSEGGSRRDLAAVLASRLGAPVLALAYFGVPGTNLPFALQRIPLEYFAGALDWLDARPEVAPGPHAVLGISRGAELALLLATTYPARIRAVVANVPSAVVWQGEGPVPGASAWTLGGADVPCLATDMSADLYARYRAAIDAGTPFAFREVYAYSLAQATPAQAAATIPVERIAGPVLLLSSRLDGVWPSDTFAAAIAARLAAARPGLPAESLTYPGSGHLLQDGYQPTTLSRYWIAYTHLMMELGGTPEGTAAANADSWPRVVAFLAANLR